MRAELQVASQGVVAVGDVPVVLRGPGRLPFAEIYASVMNFTAGKYLIRHLIRRRKLQPEDMVLDDAGREVAGELGAGDQLVYEAV